MRVRSVRTPPAAPPPGTDFNGAALVRVRSGFGRIVRAYPQRALQRGRTRESAERSGRGAAPGRRGHFNGAALVRVRSEDALAALAGKPSELQRGRTRESAERGCRERETPRRQRLQRGRTRESAERKPEISDADRAADFNGAALVRVRSDRLEGRMSLGCLRYFNGAALVRVRSGENMEWRGEKMSVLQRGRTRESAERLWSCRFSAPRRATSTGPHS